jgi:hypothetical protein
MTELHDMNIQTHGRTLKFATCRDGAMQVFQIYGASDMSRPLDEFFAGVEEEFGVDLDDQRDIFDTPGAVIEYVVSETSPSDGMTDEEHRDHVASVIGELMAQALGITRYSEDSRFLQDLHVR